MAPLSVLPGRVRFETNSLVGCREECLLLEEYMLSKQGVVDVAASHRTGRVLVKFDEGLVTRSDIEGYLEKALKAAADDPMKKEAAPLSVTRKSPASGNSSHAGHFVMEVALHALLPSPFDFLLPVAATALRR